MKHHLVILKKHYLDRILDRTKTMECRLSRTRHAPFRQVAMGDRLWLKQSGGPVVATARAGLVRFLELNNATSIAQLERRYAKRILADSSFFADHLEARYASLIHLTHVRPCDAFSVEKKGRLAWVVLPKPLSALPPRSDPPLA